MEEKGYSKWQAKYASEKQRRAAGKEYTPRPRVDKVPEELTSIGVKLERDLESQYGWKVTMKGKIRPIWVAKGTQYKDGGCKYYPAVVINYKGKQKLYSLAALIWLLHFNRRIPGGYVIDHIDNDSFNNDPTNLQMLTIRQNIEKNPSAVHKKCKKIV